MALTHGDALDLHFTSVSEPSPSRYRLRSLDLQPSAWPYTMAPATALHYRRQIGRACRLSPPRNPARYLYRVPRLRFPGCDVNLFVAYLATPLLSSSPNLSFPSLRRTQLTNKKRWPKERRLHGTILGAGFIGCSAPRILSESPPLPSSSAFTSRFPAAPFFRVLKSNVTAKSQFFVNRLIDRSID